MTAKISSSTLLTYITSGKIDDGQWRGTTTGFIIHWKEQVRKYHKLVAREEFFSDSQQKTMLQNAVHGIPELRQVKTNAELQATITHKDITFSQYDSLLQSSATQYDSSMSQVRKDRNVYLTDISDNHEANEESIEDNVTYDIDTTIDTIQANVSKSTAKASPNTRLPQDKWNHLSNEERNIWNSLSRDAKAIILGISSPSPSRLPQRRTMMHDVSAMDLISYLQENGLQQNEEQLSTEPTNDNTLLVYAASSKASISPADIRKVLSSPKNNDTSNTHGEIDINGSKYRKVNTHCLYKVSEHK